MTATLALSGDDEPWHAVDGRKGARVRTDPIAEPLRPGRLHIGEVRCAHDGDEDLCLAHLAGQAIDNHRHGVAGVIDEQLVAAHMGLAHGDRQPIVSGIISEWRAASSGIMGGFARSGATAPPQELGT